MFSYIPRFPVPSSRPIRNRRSARQTASPIDRESIDASSRIYLSSCWAHIYSLCVRSKHKHISTLTHTHTHTNQEKPARPENTTDDKMTRMQSANDVEDVVEQQSKNAFHWFCSFKIIIYVFFYITDVKRKTWIFVLDLIFKPCLFVHTHIASNAPATKAHAKHPHTHHLATYLFTYIFR